MMFPDYIGSREHRETLTRVNWRGVDQKLQLWALAYVRRACQLGIPLYVHCAHRSDADQDRLYVTGVTKVRGGFSYHNVGKAVDIVHCVKNWDLTPEQWQLLAHIGFEVAKAHNLKLICGIKWKFYDPAHWQLVGPLR